MLLLRASFEEFFLINIKLIKTFCYILIVIALWAVSFLILTPRTIEIEPTPTPTIEEIIISKAIDNNINPELFLKIAKCESGLKPDAQNKTSSASGIFQFLNSTFFSYAHAYGLSTEDKNDPLIQAELAAKMISDGGLSHWNASKNCWQ